MDGRRAVSHERIRPVNGVSSVVVYMVVLTQESVVVYMVVLTQEAAGARRCSTVSTRPGLDKLPLSSRPLLTGLSDGKFEYFTLKNWAHNLQT